MRTVGMFTTAAAVAAAAGVIFVALSSRKDLARYLKIRNM